MIEFGPRPGNEWHLERFDDQGGLVFLHLPVFTAGMNSLSRSFIALHWSLPELGDAFKNNVYYSTFFIFIFYSAYSPAQVVSRSYSVPFHELWSRYSSQRFCTNEQSSLSGKHNEAYYVYFSAGLIETSYVNQRIKSKRAFCTWKVERWVILDVLVVVMKISLMHGYVMFLTLYPVDA